MRQEDKDREFSKKKSKVLKFPLFNRGTAFTNQERDQYGLHGLLPCHVSSLDEQIKRCRSNFSRKKTPLGKYVYLMSLMNRNEALFYHFVSRYPDEMLPYIYTPTVGEAALQFSFLTWHPRGIYISYPLREKMEEMVENIPNEDVLVMVVTDGERILGLGDLGIGGMTIPVGKLALYTLFGGIHPGLTLPVTLDVGTNNRELLENDLYLGWRHTRISGEEYDKFVDTFVQAIYRKYPHALLQWEDFGKANARRLLNFYRDKVLSFNDDIQGTAGVVLAAVLSAIKVKQEKLIDQKIVIFGGGSAGIGIAEMLQQGFISRGLSPKEALERIYIIDLHGLVQYNLAPSQIDVSQRPFVKGAQDLKGWDIIDPKQITLYEVIKNSKAGILIGVSAQTGVFGKEVIEEMSRHHERPVIFPLSNPGSKAEAFPQDIIEWTKAKAIIATGTSFQPAEYLGKTYTIAQCNNVYLFPGLGLGALAAKATSITDGMIFEAAETLAEHSPALTDAAAPLLPAIHEVRAISRFVAIEVAKKAIQEKVSSLNPNEVEKRVDALRWIPD